MTMIVTCPECATGYRVDAAAFAGGGRSVRCTMCGCEWHQVGPSAADAPTDAAVPMSAAAPAPAAPAAQPSPEPTSAAASIAAAQAAAAQRREFELGATPSSKTASSKTALSKTALSKAALGETGLSETGPGKRGTGKAEPRPSDRAKPEAIEPASAKPASAKPASAEPASTTRAARSAAPRPSAAAPKALATTAPASAWDEDPDDGWSGFPDDRPARPLTPLRGANRSEARQGFGARRAHRPSATRARGRAAQHRAERPAERWVETAPRAAAGGTLASFGPTMAGSSARYRADDLGPRHFPAATAGGSAPTAAPDPSRRTLAELQREAAGRRFDGPGLRASLSLRGARRFWRVPSALAASVGAFAPSGPAAAFAGAATDRQSGPRTTAERVGVAARSFVLASVMVIGALIAYHAGPTLAARSDMATDLVAAFRGHVDDAMSQARLAASRMAHGDGVVFVESKFDLVDRPEGRALEVWGKVVNRSDRVALTPGIEIVSRARNGQPLQRWRAAPEHDRLQPGETSRFWARMMQPEGPVHDVDLYIARR